MKRVLIIEDRPLRRNSLLGEELLERLKSLSNVVLSESLPEDYSSFDVIAIHKSYMDRNALSSKLIATLSDKQKRLVVFSGGNYRQDLHFGGQLLVLSAKEFYSENLVSFIEELSVEEKCSDVILEKLVYGINNWELPVWAKIRNLEWLLQDDESNCFLEDQIDDLRKSLGISQETDVNVLIAERLGV